MLSEIVLSCLYNPITFYGENVCHINRWLVTAAMAERDLFSDQPLLDLDAVVLTPVELGSFPQNSLEKNWRYYISKDSSSLYTRNAADHLFNKKYDKNTEKYIYYLSSIYCDEEEELFMHISTMVPLPMKLWSNGKLIFVGTPAAFQKNHILAFTFAKGLNTILVEKPMCAANRKLIMAPKYFSLTIRKPATVLNNHLSKKTMLAESLHEYLNGYSLFTNKEFYSFGDNVEICVFQNRNQDSMISISVIGVEEEPIIRTVIQSGCISKIPLDSILYHGIYKITIDDTNCKYIFVGNYTDYVSNRLEKIQISDLNHFEKESLIFNLSILNQDKETIQRSIESIHNLYSQPVFSKMFHFDQSLSKAVLNEDTYFDMYGAYTSIIDEAKIAYYLELPVSYQKNQSYPLVIYLTFDDCSTGIPLRPSRVLHRKREDIISVTLKSLGDNVGDFIYESEMMEIIRELTERFSIQMNKIFLIGLCTGVRRAYKIIEHFAGLIGGMIAVAGTNIEDIGTKTFNQVPKIQLCNIDDVFYNGAMVLQNSESNPEDTYLVSNFAHEEFLDYFSHYGFPRLLFHYTNPNIPTIPCLQTQEVKCIRDIYLKKCCVFTNIENNPLLYLCRQPLKRRERNYKYLIYKNDDSIHVLEENHLIICVDLKKAFVFDNDLCDYIRTQAASAGVDPIHEGVYVSIGKNPLHSNKSLLSIAFSGKDSESLLFDLWTRFDTDSAFAKTAIIKHF